MSYFRPGMGDGPVTDPCQIDPSACPVATVPPTRVDCSQLPADSPFRQPGQPCAPENTGGITDWLLGLVKPAFASGGATSQPAAQGTSDGSVLFWGGAAAVAAYYYFTRKKR